MVSEQPIVFVIGREYTRNEIHAALGGSKVSCLPSHGGKLVAACLSQDFSPDAPSVVLCGQGPRTGPASERLTRQQGPIPVFVKRGAGRWEFHGAYRVAKSFSSGARFEGFIAVSGRSLESVSHVVLMEPTG